MPKKESDMSKENDPILDIVNNATNPVNPLTASSVEGEEEIVDQIIDSSDVDLSNSSCAAHCLLTTDMRINALRRQAESAYKPSEHEIDISPEVIEQINEARRQYFESHKK